VASRSRRIFLEIARYVFVGIHELRTEPAKRQAMRGLSKSGAALAGAAVCVLSAVAIIFAGTGGSHARPGARRGVWLLQEDLSYLAHEQQLAKAARVRRQIKAGVAHGTVGMGIGGSMPVPPPPPPPWSRGGHSWIYDDQYGTGIRPTDSVWCDCNTLAECKEKCGKAEEPEPEPEPEPALEPAPAPEPEPEEDVGQPAEVEEPAGEPPAEEAPEADSSPAEEEEEEKEPAQEEEPAEEPAAAEAPPQEEAGRGGTGYILTAPYEGYAPKLPPSGRGLPYGGVAPVLAAPPGAAGPVMYGAPYAGAAYGTPYSPAVDGGMSALLPSSWGGEDAAEHALTLSQWRVNILKSKLQQAHLRKSLMQASAPQVVEEGQGEPGEGEQGGEAEEAGGGAETAAVRRELAAEGKAVRGEAAATATAALAASSARTGAQAAQLAGEWMRGTDRQRRADRETDRREGGRGD